MPLVAQAVVGRIKAHPALLRQQALHPRVTLGTGDAVVGRCEVSGHVPRGDSPSAADRGHHVRVVLADPAPGLEDAIDRGVGSRASRCVFEGLAESGLQVAQALHGVVRARYSPGGDEGRQGGRRRSDEPAGLEHEAGSRRRRVSWSGFARAGSGHAGGGGRTANLHHRARPDPELPVRAVTIERVAPVPPGVHEFGHRAGGVGLEREVSKCLTPVHQRRNEQSHHRPADRTIVAVRQLVFDVVEHGHDGSPSSTA